MFKYREVKKKMKRIINKQNLIYMKNTKLFRQKTYRNIKIMVMRDR